ncbi:uncharacterized protein LOC135091725 isoform X2 [Scylla paramamosain]|uniref:uncharacterized protein LOC135091725 isoform X2 n=1 Tax=Scylla paramamosain TaxID=85552 RepID=UPI0030832B79
MLPPDVSSSLVPWRVMVFLIQLCGCFPFRISDTDAPPVFSLYLSLWSVFIMFTTTCVHFMGYSQIFFRYAALNIGTAVYVYTVMALLVGMTLSNVIMAVKSNKLAALLHDLSRFKDVSPPPTRRWYCKPKTIVFSVSLITVVFLMAWTSALTINVSILCSALVLLPTSLIGLVSQLLPMELPSMVFELLARHLLVATEVTMAKVSFLLNTDGCFKCEDNVKAAKEAMRDLEAVIREVEVQRERATRHFFPVVSMFLLSGLLLGVTSPYAMKVGSIEKTISLTSLFMAYYIMARLCHMGQVFVNKISTAEDLLKDMRVKCQSRSIKKEVSQVMGSLSPMRTFDVCGWYTLGYSQFLGFMNTVMTYLVIILQVEDTEVPHPLSQGLPVAPNPPAQGDFLQAGEY